MFTSPLNYRLSRGLQLQANIWKERRIQNFSHWKSNLGVRFWKRYTLQRTFRAENEFTLLSKLVRTNFATQNGAFHTHGLGNTRLARRDGSTDDYISIYNLVENKKERNLMRFDVAPVRCSRLIRPYPRCPILRAQHQAEGAFLYAVNSPRSWEKQTSRIYRHPPPLEATNAANREVPFTLNHH